MQSGAQPDEASNRLTRRPATHNRSLIHAHTVSQSFFTGQALPLNKLRFLGSRMSRGISAQKLLRARLSAACSRTVRGLGLDVDTDKSRIQSRSRTDNGCGLNATVGCSRPRPIRVRVLCAAKSTFADCPFLVRDCEELRGSGATSARTRKPNEN